MTDGTSSHYEAFESSIDEFPNTALGDEPAGQFMLYSSGTTGRPKGILRPRYTHKVHEDAGPVGALQRGLWGFDETTVYLSPAPLYHSAPISFCTAAQALGGTVTIRTDSGLYRLSSKDWDSLGGAAQAELNAAAEDAESRRHCQCGPRCQLQQVSVPRCTFHVCTFHCSSVLRTCISGIKTRKRPPIAQYHMFLIYYVIGF